MLEEAIFARPTLSRSLNNPFMAFDRCDVIYGLLAIISA